MSVLRLSSLPSFRAFEHRDYVQVWLGALISNIGTWMETLALGVYVTEVTGRAEWTGGIAALTYLPSFLLSPLAGALADRFDRRRWLMVCMGLQALLAGILTALAFSGRLSVPVVAIISFLNGCITSLAAPVYSALIAGLVPREHLHSALSLDSAQFNLGRIFGPALAAGVLAVGGIVWALLFNTLSFLAVLIALAWVRSVAHAASASAEGLWASIVHGVRVARGDAGIRLGLLGTLVVAALIAPFIGLVPVFAIQIFQGDATATSMLVTVQGAGAISAALIVGWLVERLGRRRLLEGALLLLGPVAAAYWLSPSLHFAAVAMFCLGSVYLVVLTGLSTVCKARAPKELLARVSSLFGTVLNIGYSAGIWLQGALADQVGLRLVTACAALLLLALVLALRALRPHDLDALEAN
jgi:MFS family permease